MKIILKKGIKGMIYLGRKVFVGICILIIIALGIAAGLYLYDMNNINQKAINNNVTQVNNEENDIEMMNTLEIANQGEKTTPNTLITYKTYYTKCNHYINEYKDIDISSVNLNEEEIKEKNKDWRIKEFSPEQIVLEKEVEEFCNQHYKLKLLDDNIIVFTIDENNYEKEYQKTEITSEYLTDEDVVKLKEGILVYGKENLSSVLEDYE